MARLKQEGFSRVKLIYKGGQGATFRVIRGNSIYCLKLYLFCDSAMLEYNYWSQIWRRATHYRYLVGFHETVKEVSIGGRILSYILMDYHPTTLHESMASEHVRGNALKLYR